MVPLHLRLFNFLSYQGDTELDLRGIHVGCLSGDNGNGKSALLDAVTWALWGWARGRRYGTGGASPDELVYQGQTDMEVALTFAAGEATYRMVRKHSKGGGRRGAARMVDLQAATGDGFRSLTEGSVAETEAQVQRLLRMSYDTFVKSAFLLQGEADRFTTSKPAQRKETLADILGLSLYERLQDRAKERVREYDAQLLRNQLDRDATERELANRPGVEQSLDDARRMLEGLAPLLSVARAEEAALEARVASLERVQEEADRLRESVGQRTAEAERLEAHADQARDRAARYSNVLARRAEMLDGAGRLVAAQQLLAELGEGQQQDAVFGAASAMELGVRHCTGGGPAGLGGGPAAGPHGARTAPKGGARAGGAGRSHGQCSGRGRRRPAARGSAGPACRSRRDGAWRSSGWMPTTSGWMPSLRSCVAATGC